MSLNGARSELSYEREDLRAMGGKARRRASLKALKRRYNRRYNRRLRAASRRQCRCAPA